MCGTALQFSAPVQLQSPAQLQRKAPPRQNLAAHYSSPQDTMAVDLTGHGPEADSCTAFGKGTQEDAIMICDSDDDEKDKKMAAVVVPNRDCKIVALDARLARQIKEEEEQQIKERKEQEKKAMYHGETGRAFLLVEKVLQGYHKILEDKDDGLFQVANPLETAKKGNLCSFGKDDMVYLAEKMMKCQADFKAKNKPIQVEIAYHYTQKERLHSIRQDGLLVSKNLARHGATYGNGIYVGNNPYAFRPYGDTGLLMAIIKGTEHRLASSKEREAITTTHSGINTVIGNKVGRDGAREPGFDEIVLQESCQVLPLMRFSKDLIDLSCLLSHNGNSLLWKFHVKMQELLDDFFQNPTPVLPIRVVPTAAALQRLASAFANRRQRGVWQVITDRDLFLRVARKHLKKHYPMVVPMVEMKIHLNPSLPPESLKKLIGNHHWNIVTELYAKAIKKQLQKQNRTVVAAAGFITGEPLALTADGTDQQHASAPASAARRSASTIPQKRLSKTTEGVSAAMAAFSGYQVAKLSKRRRTESPNAGVQFSSTLKIPVEYGGTLESAHGLLTVIFKYLKKHDRPMYQQLKALAPRFSENPMGLVSYIQQLVGFEIWRTILQLHQKGRGSQSHALSQIPTGTTLHLGAPLAGAGSSMAQPGSSQNAASLLAQHALRNPTAPSSTQPRAGNDEKTGMVEAMNFGALRVGAGSSMAQSGRSQNAAALWAQHALRNPTTPSSTQALAGDNRNTGMIGAMKERAQPASRKRSWEEDDQARPAKRRKLSPPTTQTASQQRQGWVGPTQQPQAVQAALASATAIPIASATSLSNDTATYTGSILYQAPQKLREPYDRCSLRSPEGCSLCSKPLCGNIVMLKGCYHKYHKKCIKPLVHDAFRCPTCSEPAGEPQGKAPSGSMKVQHSPIVCADFEACNGSFVIEYVLPRGRQHCYHQSPGLAYKGSTRRAYLPNNEAGRKLLRRLKYAFARGLLFSIGRSQTTGENGRVIWGSVPHKTSVSPGEFGFGGDPGYFERCNEALDHLNVPKAGELSHGGLRSYGSAF